MSNHVGQTIDCVEVDTGHAYCGEWDADMTALPDLTDPATLGCLLALVREAWRDHIVAKFGNGWWELETDGARWDDATTQSFVEALVAALESAP